MSFYLRDVLGIQKGSNGCESLKTLIYGIFKILQSYDIDIDYVYCDIETIFNDARTLNVRRFDENIENALKKYTSISKRIDNRDIIYNDIIYTELQNRKDIWDNITQRGYFFDNSKLNDIKKVSSGNGSEYYGIANAKSYEHRRNINVWDAVMKTYENDLFYDYIFKPILSLEKYKLTKCSSNSRFEAKGYINRANMFETYLGGSVSVNENMYSSIPLYEDYVSEGYKKLSMDNWKTLPKQLDNIFQFFVGHINRIRGTELSSRGKFNVFFASWNIWAFELNKRIKFRKNNTSKDSYLEQISKLYYQELLYHIFLSCPDKAIAYFIIETKRDVADIQYYIDLVTDDIKSIYSIEYICHYYTNCYENLSQILSNFNKKTGGANLTSLNKTLAIEPYPFVISGVTNNDNNIWRITCDSQFKLEINDTENPSISINGKNIKFSSGNISSDDDNDTKIGCWITTPKDVFPVIETEADYYSQINPVYKTQNITDFPDYRTYTLFGELPKNHAVSLRFNLSQFNKYYARLLYSGVLKPLEVILGYENDTFDNQIKDIPFYIKGAGENYNIINLKPNNDYILQLFITIAEINTEGFNLSATYKLFDCKNSDFSNILIDETLENITYKPDNNIIHFLMSGLKIVSPESSLKGVDKDNFLKHFNIKEFKIYHSGFNVKTEIFKTHNGINYSRVNKRIPAYSDMPVCSKKGDTYIAKISWLNATNNDIDCKLIFNVNSNQFNIEKNLITFTNDGSVIFNDDFNSNQKLIISSNSEGYLFIKLPVIMSEETTFSLSLHY